MRGHIKKRGNKYSFVIDLGRDPVTKKRLQKRFSGFNTSREAQKAMTKIINDLNSGAYVEPTKEKIEDYLEDWIKSKEKNVRQNTIDTYRYIIHAHINPTIGKLELSKVNAVHIERLYNDMSDDYSGWTVFKAHTILRMAFSKAKRYKIITEDPTEYVDPPKIEKKVMDYWDEDEALQFFSHEEIQAAREYIAFLLPFTTGMRQGEVLGLRFRDINFEKKYLSVNVTANYKNKSLDEPKTRTSIRRIYLDDFTIDALKQHRKNIYEEKLQKGPEYDDNDLVIPTANGTIYNPSNLRRMFHKLINKSDVRIIRYHDLRHTHATHMLQQPDADIKMVSERLGHANIKITLETYYHVMPGKQEKAAQQYGDYFFKNNALSD